MTTFKNALSYTPGRKPSPMAKNIIRATIAVAVDDNNDPHRVAQSMREAKVGEKLAQYLTNVAGPNAHEDVELTVENLPDESLIHVCDYYEDEDCHTCRHAAAYTLEYTTRRLFG